MSESKINVVAEVAEKMGIDVHYLWNADPEYDGVSALCDLEAGLDEAPRTTTLSSSFIPEVTCSDCLRELAKETS